MKKDYDLGKGISALFADISSDGDHDPTPVEGAHSMPLQNIVVNPDQPRKEFSEDDLRDLADSIKTHGIVQPIVVRPKGSVFEIVAGERRYRAAQRCGLPTVPVVVKNLSDKESYAIALIENLQRANLTPIEEAEAFALLIKTHQMTQEEVARYVGKTRPYISNSMRLLTLPEDVRTLVQDGHVTAGHARALVGHEKASDVAQKIVEEKLTVRDVEQLTKGDAPHVDTNQQDIESIERALSSVLKMSVRVTLRQKGGRVEILWKNLEELEQLLSVFYEKK